MTFEEAKVELKKMAGEHFCCIIYGYNYYTSGTEQNDCVLYIDLGWHGEVTGDEKDGRMRVSSRNWDDSVTAMRVKLGLTTPHINQEPK